MGKASSNKKVARAAKAGGGRARAAGERNLLFPASLLVVVVLGTLLVLYARDNRSAEALEPPLIGDHWHAAVGFYVCDEFVTPLAEFSGAGGIHTHGSSGLLHIEPSSSAAAGENATLQNALEDAQEALGGGKGLSDDALGVPGGDSYVEGEDTCDDVDGDPIVQVAVWDSRKEAENGEEPAVLTENFDLIRFGNDGEVFTVAFAPEGTDLPVPANADELAEVPEPPAPPGSTPGEAEQPSDGPAADDTTPATSAEQPATTSAVDASDEPTPSSDADNGQ